MARWSPWTGFDFIITNSFDGANMANGSYLGPDDILYIWGEYTFSKTC